jgi:hypothetical protein
VLIHLARRRWAHYNAEQSAPGDDASALSAVEVIEWCQEHRGAKLAPA